VHIRPWPHSQNDSLLAYLSCLAGVESSAFPVSDYNYLQKRLHKLRGYSHTPYFLNESVLQRLTHRLDSKIKRSRTHMFAFFYRNRKAHPTTSIFYGALCIENHLNVFVSNPTAVTCNRIELTSYLHIHIENTYERWISFGGRAQASVQSGTRGSYNFAK
jgi:hypothetical protein